MDQGANYVDSHGDRHLDRRQDSGHAGARALPGGAIVLRLYDEQTRWGEFEQLEAFLQEHTVPYTRRADGDCQYDPAVVEFRPGTPPLQLAANKDGEPVVAVSLLTELANGLNLAASADSRAAMVQEIKVVQRLLVEILPPHVPALESLEIGAE